MTLVHRSTVKNADGVIDIDITLVDDRITNQTYHLSSEWAAREFHRLYRKRNSEGALAVLNKFKI